MTNLIKAEILVTREAASLLLDRERADRIGGLVSEMLRPTTPETDPLGPLIRELKAEVQASGLTEEEIDAKLPADNAERRN